MIPQVLKCGHLTHLTFVSFTQNLVSLVLYTSVCQSDDPSTKVVIFTTIPKSCLLSGLPIRPSGEESVCNAGGPRMLALSPKWGRSLLKKGDGNPLQIFLENPILEEFGGLAAHRAVIGL